MAKNKNKNKKGFTPPKPKPKLVTLKSKIQSVYNNNVNMDTACAHRCECCNVAMPQMNYCEFLQLINTIWTRDDDLFKIQLICTSVEYFFRNEFEKWGKESMIKPCMLLTDKGMCGEYEDRPLSCRLYGLWPEGDYNARVDKFEKAYEGLMTREEIPLNKQCPFVERTNIDKPITKELIDSMFQQLDDIDLKLGEYSEMEIKQKLNYRTFHDWLLLRVFGEDWLVLLTKFMMSADKEAIQDQIEAIKDSVRKRFIVEMPEIRTLEGMSDEIDAIKVESEEERDPFYPASEYLDKWVNKKVEVFGGKSKTNSIEDGRRGVVVDWDDGYPMVEFEDGDMFNVDLAHLREVKDA